MWDKMMSLYAILEPTAFCDKIQLMKLATA